MTYAVAAAGRCCHSVFIGYACHHADELFEGDLSITIGIHLIDYLVHVFAAKLLLSKRQDFTDLISCDYTRAIFVKHAESGL